MIIRQNDKEHPISLTYRKKSFVFIFRSFIVFIISVSVDSFPWCREPFCQSYSPQTFKKTNVLTPTWQKQENERDRLRKGCGGRKKGGRKKDLCFSQMGRFSIPPPSRPKWQVLYSPCHLSIHSFIHSSFI